jgi:hypothetical protein
MNIAAIKSEIAGLPLEERRELIGYIVSLNRKDNGEFMRKMAEKIDDKSPERWLTLEEVEKRLGA